MWTKFNDMHSGGYLKLKFTACYIQAPLIEAVDIFKIIFDRDPRSVTCGCCGNDYDVDEEKTLEEFSTAGLTLKAYFAQPTIRLIQINDV